MTFFQVENEVNHNYLTASTKITISTKTYKILHEYNNQVVDGVYGTFRHQSFKCQITNFSFCYQVFSC